MSSLYFLFRRPGERVDVIDRIEVRLRERLMTFSPEVYTSVIGCMSNRVSSFKKSFNFLLSFYRLQLMCPDGRDMYSRVIEFTVLPGQVIKLYY